ncbi:MAG: hypothetical protein UT48_C0031G0010 [Parcubacteria group bacterium GW2011_GWE2_39_37]|uniref:CBS domain-containing protein n=1 Tax=Candidatus Falkowbacteria bacterium GW2011_GWF2_39_8 TaxID=1618642 RepID=A0A0G0PXG6_9BACT|nr:MAG: hypothetical protein UT48_C0031G0010 [Parcubacteria group bacterium GW2011_GWE2_39_37]KKR32834.1 MAG: hypothetical protein UT64_C0021G0005 [Candidatus Falkowbacteria bacterium GW2011_GWF2_39_8]
MNAKNIMSKRVISVKPEASISEVAAILHGKGFHALPVVDRQKRLLGIITETDLFARSFPMIHLPTYIDFLKKSKLDGNLSIKQRKSFEKLTQAEAKDVMSETPFVISPFISIEKILKIFQKNKIYSLPVINNDKKVIGIITLSDIINLLSKKKLIIK